MKGLENRILGGSYQLSAAGRWLDPESRTIWENKGQRLEDGVEVLVILFKPEISGGARMEKIRELENSYDGYHFVENGAHQFGTLISPYTIFAKNKVEKEEMQPLQSSSKSQQQAVYSNGASPKYPVVPPVKPRAETPSRRGLVIAGIVVVLICVVIGIIGGPTIMTMFQPPTPTATVTPISTPQIFTFALDTTIKNFVTGESFVIPKGSKIIIINPTHTVCEVLADWNGTQVIVPANVIFPDRTTCP